MTVESATYVSQLNSALPADSDEIPEGDNHIRLTKTVLLNSIGSLGAAALTVTAAQVNDVTNKSLRAGDTYTGAHNFTGATTTVATPVAGADAVPKSYADSLAIASTAPTWAVTNTATSKTLAAFEFCRVTASGQTITFPPSPTYGVTRIGIELDPTVTCTLDPNGLPIKQSAGTMTCNRPGLTLTFTAISATTGWVIGV